MPTPTPSTPAARSKPLLVDFALQGGGSHGAFTWGVLDRLLQEPWLQIDGISGTSAGAMNAAVLSDGYAEGGAEGGRAALDRCLSTGFNPFGSGPTPIFLRHRDAEAPDADAKPCMPPDTENARC